MRCCCKGCEQTSQAHFSSSCLNSGWHLFLLVLAHLLNSTLVFCKQPFLMPLTQVLHNAMPYNAMQHNKIQFDSPKCIHGQSVWRGLVLFTQSSPVYKKQVLYNKLYNNECNVNRLQCDNVQTSTSAQRLSLTPDLAPACTANSQHQQKTLK